MKNFSLKTKESFRPSSKETHTKTYVVWALVAFVVLVVLKDVITGGTAFFAQSLYSVRHYFLTSSATIPLFLQSRLELLERITSLETELASQRGMSTTYTYVSEENKELRALLSASSSPRIGAGVVARPPFTPYDTVIIDRGSEDGVVLHAPVYYGSNIALGYVRSVFPHTALITLFSSSGVETTVYLFGAHIFTTAYGEGGGVIRISVPQGVPLEEGRLVVLPSLDTGVLGTIRSIQSISTEPEQHAYVTLDEPLQSIRLVSVGTRAVEEATFEEAKEHVEETEKQLFTITIPEDEREFSASASVATDTIMHTTTSTTTQP